MRHVRSIERAFTAKAIIEATEATVTATAKATIEAATEATTVAAAIAATQLTLSGAKQVARYSEDAQ